MPTRRSPGAAPRSYVCKACGETFEGVGAFGALGKHRSIVHPRSASVSRETGAGGARRIEDVSEAGDTVARLAGSPESPASDSPDPDATGGRLRPTRPQVAQPSIRMTSEAQRESVSDAIRDALPLATLADILHSLSVAVSEADGAGEAGYLSPIQCTQVASLLYDSTVDLVVTRFDGNISRFKAAMAVVVILASKGTVHARAIRGKMAERRQAPVRVPLPAPEDDGSQNGHAPVIAGVPLVPPGMEATYREAAMRQAGILGRTVES